MNLQDTQEKLSIKVALKKVFFFTYYLANAELTEIYQQGGKSACIGLKVRVPLKSTQQKAVILDIFFAKFTSKLKPMHGLLDDPKIPAKSIEIIYWLVNYYKLGADFFFQKNLWETFAHAKKPHSQQLGFWVLDKNQCTKTKKLSPAQTKSIDILASQSFLNSFDLSHFQISISTIQSLVKQKLVSHETFLPQREKLQLSESQKNTSESIQKNSTGFSSHYIEGITGSGKSYILADILKKTPGQKLLLVPEIAIAEKTRILLQSFFPEIVFSFHSNTSDSLKSCIIRKIDQGEDILLVATRSGLFLPWMNLKLICIDEEQDKSLAQTQQHYFYHARDVALKYAQQLDIPIIITSATPSLALFARKESPSINWYNLESRFYGTQMPEIQLQEPLENQLIHPSILHKIQSCLEQGEKVLVYINRRGYSELIYCKNCSHKILCPSCSRNLTYHKPQHLLSCHYCDLSYPYPEICSVCQARDYLGVGVGTQKYEEYLQSLCTNGTSLFRLDKDTVGTNYQKMIEKFSMDTPMLIVGTQLLAKSFTIKSLQLVVILGIDTAFYSQDVFSLENAMQSLFQVAGRAGREKKQGLVLIQTQQIGNPLLELATKHDYQLVQDYLLQQREKHAFPPYASMAILLIRSKGLVKCENKAQELLDYCRSLNTNLQILGVFNGKPAQVESYHFRQIWLLGERRILHTLLAKITELKGFMQDFSIRVDPIETSN